MASKKLSFATWLRAISTVMILLCHYCAQSASPVIGMLSQFFNIGVHLFFILSGFLTGYNGIKHPVSSWYSKKFQRIYIPFWLFIGTLGSVYLIKGLDVFTPEWFFLVLGLQGSNVGVWGAEQTWFISVILLCYALAPLILRAISKITELENNKILFLFIVLVSVMPILFALAEEPWIYVVFTPISLYTLACIAGQRYQSIPCSLQRVVFAAAIALVAFAVRFVGKYLWDGTILYDRVIVQYTHMIAAGAITYSFFAVINNSPVPYVVQLISDISFEIYLYHYMFTVGPISMFGHFNSWVTSCIWTTIIVMIVSLAFNRVSAWIVNRLFK